jgi:LacI family gluconate utilization system Gnt-I transcriptional repressor
VGQDRLTQPEAIKKTGRRNSGRPTITDVARLAGVAAITVSRALRDPSLVSAELRRQIEAAVAELGYEPNVNARALASSRADVIAVLVPSLTNIVFADFISGVYKALRGNRLQIQIGNTHYSPREEERLVAMFLGQRPSGLIVSGIDQSKATLKLLQTAGCPVVQVMEYDDEPVDMLVGFSHFEGGKAATRHLVEAGYSRIGFIGARMDPRSQRRLAGYRLALEEAGIFDPALIVTTPTPSSVPLGGELLCQAMAKTPALDAVFCNNDDLALGVLFEAQRQAIRVPQALGICGFNDLDLMGVAHPRLTSVRTPRFETGHRAVQMVLRRLQGGAEEQRCVDLGFQLQVRDSTMRDAP